MPIMSSRSLLLLLAGVLVAISAVAVATMAMGPVVRLVFGEPHDYRSDYVSVETLLQALTVVTATMFLMCTACGWLAAQVGKVLTWREAIWMLNPLTIGVAFVILMHLVYGTSIGGVFYPGEYLSPAMQVIQVLGSPVYFAAVRLGVLLHPASRSTSALE